MTRQPSLRTTLVLLLCALRGVATAAQRQRVLGHVHTLGGEMVISDEKGRLQYIPFPACNETGRPLTLRFGVDADLNCTIAFVDDPFFHLLEFYVHNDTPLTCRLPVRPLDPLKKGPGEIAMPIAGGGTPPAAADGGAGADGEYIPLTFALTGTLQLSHLHVANRLNVLVHEVEERPGVLDSAIAYSVTPNRENARIVIGDVLVLRLRVRWFRGSGVDKAGAGLGGHLTGSTVVYCLFSALCGVFFSIAYFRAYELPNRLRRYSAARLSHHAGGAGGRGGYGYSSGLNGGYPPGYGGYGIGSGGSEWGKKD
ncbi:MAG: hypothetical protein M1839_000757 [Geoglossum umbratile]|nr:MAG: hypothetical protein M1839_000757 [Geoglossum umbratile]